jgi:hypothetical protein
MYYLQPLSRGCESYSDHGYMSAFTCVYVVPCGCKPPKLCFPTREKERVGVLQQFYSTRQITYSCFSRMTASNGSAAQEQL